MPYPGEKQDFFYWLGENFTDRLGGTRDSGIAFFWAVVAGVIVFGSAAAVLIYEISTGVYR